jgi:hypothetical protein
LGDLNVRRRACSFLAFRTAVYCIVPCNDIGFRPASKGIGIVESHPIEKGCASETLRVNSPASATKLIFDSLKLTDYREIHFPLDRPFILWLLGK